MHRLVLVVLVALAAALVLVSLSAAAHQQRASCTRLPTPHRLALAVRDRRSLRDRRRPAGRRRRQPLELPGAGAADDLSGFAPNVEAIADYKPDLVLISYDPGNLLAARSSASRS